MSEHNVDFGEKEPIDDQETQPLKLDDLNIDCLGRIFMFLELNDLLNIADSNKYLKQTADVVFVSKYGRKNLSLHCICIPYKPRDWILVKELKSCLQLLRCFGKSISKLLLCSDSHNSTYVRLFKHIVGYCEEYCAEFLTDITIVNGEKVMKLFQKPFPNVTAVRIDRTTLEKKLLNELFPKMESLSFTNTRGFKVSDHVVDHFPCLKHLRMSAGPHWEPHVIPILQLNKQLRSLELNTSYKFLEEALEVVSNQLHQLESLDVVLENVSYNYVEYIVKEFHLNILKNLTIRVNKTFGSVREFHMFCEKLEELAIFTIYLSPSEIPEFLCRYKSIKKLTLYIAEQDECIVSALEQSKWLEPMASLEEINLRGWCLTVEPIIAMTTKLKGIKRFVLDMATISEYNELSTRLSDKWQCTSTKSWRGFNVRLVKRESD